MQRKQKKRNPFAKELAKNEYRQRRLERLDYKKRKEQNDKPEEEDGVSD